MFKIQIIEKNDFLINCFDQTHNYIMGQILPLPKRIPKPTNDQNLLLQQMGIIDN